MLNQSVGKLEVGNAYSVNGANYHNNNAIGPATNEIPERTGRLKCTSEQGRYLAYLTIKHMVRTQGPHFNKGISLGLSTWVLITRELNTMGIVKTPEQWRKCYSAAKYFAHMRFSRLMRDKQAITGNPNVRPDWSEIEIRDLFYLQDWRSKGFPDLPEPDLLLRAFENKQLFLHDYQPTSPKPTNYNYGRDLFYDNNSYSNSFSDFSQFPTQHQNNDSAANHEEIQIKCELDASIDVDASEEFHQQLQQMVDAHSRMEYATTTSASGGGGNRPTSQNTPPISMPKPLQFHPPSTPNPTAPEQDSATVSTSSKISNTNALPYRYRDSIESEFNGAPANDYFERRILEINEKLLKEKIKQNKLLKKKNKFLKQSRKEQKKHTETLNKLLEQLVRSRT